MRYRLTTAAEHDVEVIFLQSLDQFGLAQAERYHNGLTEAFEFLADFPLAVQEREEIDPPVRIYPYQAHLIIYEVEAEKQILILRVRHGREDWLTES